MDSIHAEDQLSDFSLTSFEEDSSSDVVEMVIGGIAADIKNSAPVNLPMVDIEEMLNKAANSSSMMPPVPPMPPMPFMPVPNGAAWGWPGLNENVKDQWEDFWSKMEAFWGQQRDRQKSSMKAARKRWGSFF